MKNACSGSNVNHQRKDYNDWWPERLNINLLKDNCNCNSPLESNFDYAKAFSTIKYEELKKDIKALMVTSQEWWPADWGHYGPLFIRMAWHSAGTYRVVDGRGGANGAYQRFAPLNSWPDNANLDKARRLLEPIKQKYGNKISWADLLVLAGNIALESMGFKTFGFAGGREDAWSADAQTYWGPETKWLESRRHKADGKLVEALAADHMGLIYVNPEGPNGVPDALGAASQIRDSFARMGMNDEETVALIAGGHSFGKNHGVANPDKFLEAEPEAANLKEVGLGWKNNYQSGKGSDTITSGIEGAWTPTPTKWDNSFLRILFEYEWTLKKSPAGAWQWEAVNPKDDDMVVDAHDKDVKHAPIMLTTDLSLKMDEHYKKIAKEFLDDHQKFSTAFAKAWFKLIHRDLGPKNRYVGFEIPSEDFLWQDPLPKASYTQIDSNDIIVLKQSLLEKSTITDLVWLAWSGASTYRDSDKRGGINGARIVLEPQKSWEVNEPERLDTILNTLKAIKEEFNTQDKKVSIADLIVLGSCAAIEKSTKEAGFDLEVGFSAGRVDISQELIDISSYIWFKPKADAFRNYVCEGCEELEEELMLDKALQLKLTAPELVVLMGGLRMLGVTYKRDTRGVLTDKIGVLSSDYFKNLLDMDILWNEDKDGFTGIERKNNKARWRASRVDLIFASNPELRALIEFYAQEDNQERFINDFVKTWQKVTELDII